MSKRSRKSHPDRVDIGEYLSGRTISEHRLVKINVNNVQMEDEKGKRVTRLYIRKVAARISRKEQIDSEEGVLELGTKSDVDKLKSTVSDIIINRNGETKK